MLYGLALLAGIVAGSRVFTGIAAVSWAAKLGAPQSRYGSWLRSWAIPGRRGSSRSWRLSNTSPTSSRPRPCRARKVPMQFGAGSWAAPCPGRQSAFQPARGSLGAIAGAIGAVIGTYGGAEIRGSLAKAFGVTNPPHSSRTPAPSFLGSSSSGRCGEPPFRRDRDRRRPGWTADGRPACGGGAEGRAHRA